MSDAERMDLERLLGGLRAAGEGTRLRVLSVLARSELTVSELTTVLVQSQPRVSRHLKLLHEAGLIDRFREGAWVFYRLAGRGPGAALARALVALVARDDTVLARDFARLEGVRQARARVAAEYFRDNAARWDRIRSLYVPEAAVERALLDAAGDGPFQDMLDLGTGTGRMLEVFAPRVRRGLGLDLSHEMLSVARTNLDRAGLAQCQVRQGDLYHLPLEDGSFDLVTVHQVLHYLDEPAVALAEAARVLAPGGCLLVVDFAPHGLEFLRDEHAHRRLGFADVELRDWCRACGLACGPARVLAAPGNGHEGLTVCIWRAEQRASRGAARTREEVVQ